MRRWQTCRPFTSAHAKPCSSPAPCWWPDHCSRPRQGFTRRPPSRSTWVRRITPSTPGFGSLTVSTSSKSVRRAQKANIAKAGLALLFAAYQVNWAIKDDPAHQRPLPQVHWRAAAQLQQIADLGGQQPQKRKLRRAGHSGPQQVGDLAPEHRREPGASHPPHRGPDSRFVKVFDRVRSAPLTRERFFRRTAHGGQHFKQSALQTASRSERSPRRFLG